MSAPASPPFSVSAARRVSRLLTHLGVSPDAFDDALGLVTPLARVHRLQARVLRCHRETPTATTVELETGAALAALKPGQHMVFGFTLDGVRHRRAYSPRAVPGHRHRIAITVQAQPGGRVSNHVLNGLKPGAVIDIDPPSGDFVLPEPPPARLLLIAGGSGITPGMAMLQHLRAHAAHAQVTLIYFARSADERIFRDDLASLARAWPSFNYHPIDSTAHTLARAASPAAAAPCAAPGALLTHPLLDKALLDSLAPDWARMPTFCCGPASLMDAARALWAQAGASEGLRLEAFAGPRANGDPQARHQVRLSRQPRHHTFEAPGHLSLLVAGEQAGLTIKHGCRRGICHECTCRLRRGSVQDLGTGSRIDAEGQPIRLCVTAPLSDVELESLT